MWVTVPCIECDGKGDISGIAGYDEKGVEVEGFFPCERCNGEGNEPIWFDDCPKCNGTGVRPGSFGGEVCHNCFGKGHLKPKPAPKTSHWESVSDA